MSKKDNNFENTEKTSLFTVISHIHTNHSLDSNLSVEEILSYAVNNHVDAVLICDHNKVSGAMEAALSPMSDKVKVIAAVEFFTDAGDIIGAFLNEDMCGERPDFFTIRHRWQEVIKFIREKDGIVILPHPFKSHRLSQELIDNVDLIESFNSRCTVDENRLAEGLAKRFNKPVISGNDAHLANELGLSRTVFHSSVPKNDDELKKVLLVSERTVTGRYSKGINVMVSQMLIPVKEKNIRVLFFVIKSMLSRKLMRLIQRGHAGRMRK